MKGTVNNNNERNIGSPILVVQRYKMLSAVRQIEAFVFLWNRLLHKMKWRFEVAIKVLRMGKNILKRRL
jgi:hypothetical protein